MRAQALRVLFFSLFALAAPALIALAPAPATPIAPAAAVTASGDGDKVVADVTVLTASGSVVATFPAMSIVVGDAAGPLPGLGAAFENVTAGEHVRANLQPWQAYGNWSWSNVVNVSREDDLPRVSVVTRVALERFTGHAAKQGDVVALELWKATVVALDGSHATLRADPPVGSSVSYYRQWSSTVVAVNESTVRLRHDATPGLRVTDGGEGDDERPAREGRVTLVNDTVVRVDFNPPLAGEDVLVDANVLSVKPGTATRALVATAVSRDSCERCHARQGFQAFQAASSVQPNANGTSWVNVTVTNPWRHELRGASAVVGNATRALPRIPAGRSATVSVLVPASKSVPVAVTGTAHFAHGGSMPDDLNYAARSAIDASKRRAAAPVLASARVATGSGWLAFGRATGWAVLPLMLYPAWQGYRVARRRKLGLAVKRAWPKWIDWHVTPSLAAILVGFTHGASLMLRDYRGAGGPGVWTGYFALAALGVLGLTGIVLARWAPPRWKGARKAHAWITLAAIALGALHAALIGTTLRFLR